MPQGLWDVLLSHEQSFIGTVIGGGGGVPLVGTVIGGGGGVRYSLLRAVSIRGSIPSRVSNWQAWRGTLGADGHFFGGSRGGDEEFRV